MYTFQLNTSRIHPNSKKKYYGLLGWSFITSLNHKVAICWGFFRLSAPTCTGTATGVVSPKKSHHIKWSYNFCAVRSGYVIKKRVWFCTFEKKDMKIATFGAYCVHVVLLAASLASYRYSLLTHSAKTHLLTLARAQIIMNFSISRTRWMVWLVSNTTDFSNAI